MKSIVFNGKELNGVVTQDSPDSYTSRIAIPGYGFWIGYGDSVQEAIEDSCKMMASQIYRSIQTPFSQPEMALSYEGE